MARRKCEALIRECARICNSYLRGPGEGHAFVCLVAIQVALVALALVCATIQRWPCGNIWSVLATAHVCGEPQAFPRYRLDTVQFRDVACLVHGQQARRLYCMMGMMFGLFECQLLPFMVQRNLLHHQTICGVFLRNKLQGFIVELKDFYF